MLQQQKETFLNVIQVKNISVFVVMLLAIGFSAAVYAGDEEAEAAKKVAEKVKHKSEELEDSEGDSAESSSSGESIPPQKPKTPAEARQEAYDQEQIKLDVEIKELEVAKLKIKSEPKEKADEESEEIQSKIRLKEIDKERSEAQKKYEDALELEIQGGSTEKIASLKANLDKAKKHVEDQKKLALDISKAKEDILKLKKLKKEGLLTAEAQADNDYKIRLAQAKIANLRAQQNYTYSANKASPMSADERASLEARVNITNNNIYALINKEKERLALRDEIDRKLRVAITDPSGNVIDPAKKATADIKIETKAKEESAEHSKANEFIEDATVDDIERLKMQAWNLDPSNGNDSPEKKAEREFIYAKIAQLEATPEQKTQTEKNLELAKANYVKSRSSGPVVLDDPDLKKPAENADASASFKSFGEERLKEWARKLGETIVDPKGKVFDPLVKAYKVSQKEAKEEEARKQGLEVRGTAQDEMNRRLNQEKIDKEHAARVTRTQSEGAAALLGNTFKLVEASEAKIMAEEAKRKRKEEKEEEDAMRTLADNMLEAESIENGYFAMHGVRKSFLEIKDEERAQEEKAEAQKKQREAVINSPTNLANMEAAALRIARGDIPYDPKQAAALFGQLPSFGGSLEDWHKYTTRDGFGEMAEGFEKLTAAREAAAKVVGHAQIATGAYTSGREALEHGAKEAAKAGERVAGEVALRIGDEAIKKATLEAGKNTAIVAFADIVGGMQGEQGRTSMSARINESGVITFSADVPKPPSELPEQVAEGVEAVADIYDAAKSPTPLTWGMILAKNMLKTPTHIADRMVETQNEERARMIEGMNRMVQRMQQEDPLWYTKGVMSDEAVGWIYSAANQLDEKNGTAGFQRGARAKMYYEAWLMAREAARRSGRL